MICPDSTDDEVVHPGLRGFQKVTVKNGCGQVSNKLLLLAIPTYLYSVKGRQIEKSYTDRSVRIVTSVGTPIRKGIQCPVPPETYNCASPRLYQPKMYWKKYAQGLTPKI